MPEPVKVEFYGLLFYNLWGYWKNKNIFSFCPFLALLVLIVIYAISFLIIKLKNHDKGNFWKPFFGYCSGERPGQYL
jgi:hypothetical protein